MTGWTSFPDPPCAPCYEPRAQQARVLVSAASFETEGGGGGNERPPSVH